MPPATSCSISSRKSATSPREAAARDPNLTPTISQRRVKSSISVNSGQTVLLAGLISETESKQRQGIPLLDSIPGVGDAFSHQNKTRARTELILFIRPTVIKDALDAHVIAEEMRTKMNSRLVGTSNRVIVVDPKTGLARPGRDRPIAPAHRRSASRFSPR